MSPLRFLAAAVAPLGITLSTAAALELGAALPAVTVLDHEGHELRLAESAGRGWTLVYFYPKADTPGCTKQACSLRDAFATLSERKVTVFGVSMDDVAAQKAFHQKYRLPFLLLADEKGVVADAFGVPHALGFAKRQAFLFKDGKLVWRDLSASTEQQAADVLSQIQP
ncbi:MAG: peroxiredoxin [Verrucomicrobia bacterium]|nr:MAG: peroxiredoxin [Verrucomicrobiota bacterium]TAE88003.1 MAG: peroxiredoxin [Verrucomicrobiota bacterium]TAF26227.1 MAG: peroxiredoxin [Verrucomicrobiota bacterium]TAF41782.1 MAG: peroxiredoxin [Verrucomicrobiota bacterium]